MQHTTFAATFLAFPAIEFTSVSCADSGTVVSRIRFVVGLIHVTHFVALASRLDSRMCCCSFNDITELGESLVGVDDDGYTLSNPSARNCRRAMSSSSRWNTCQMLQVSAFFVALRRYCHCLVLLWTFSSTLYDSSATLSSTYFVKHGLAIVANRDAGGAHPLDTHTPLPVA